MQKAKIQHRHKEINFYERYFYDPEAAGRKRRMLLTSIPIAVLLVAILGVFGFLKISDAIHKQEMKEINEYLTSSATMRQYNEALRLQAEQDRLSETYNAMNLVINMEKMLPAMETSRIATINSALKGAKVDSMIFKAPDGTLVLTAKTATASEVPGVIKRLKATGLFSSVTYTGYQDNESKYIATISCKLFQ